MRARILIFASLLAAPAAQGFPIQFEEPAKLHGEADVQAEAWVGTRLPEGVGLRLTLHSPGTLVFRNQTSYANLDTNYGSAEVLPPDQSEERTAFPPMEMHLTAGQGGATLVAKVGGSLRAVAEMSLHQLTADSFTASLEDSALADSWSGWGPAGGPLVGLRATNGLLDLGATPASAVEWFNMVPTCPGHNVCPEGGGATNRRFGTADVAMAITTARFERLEGDISVFGTWVDLPWVVASPRLDLVLEGNALLPGADAHACDACPPLEDRALRVLGNIRLEDLHSREGRFEADMTGTFGSVRVDEEWLSPAVLGGLGAGVLMASGAVLAIKLLLLPLFTSLSKAKALEHPKRQQIFQYVQLHPGANFREVARNTGIAAGTARHHLTILERAGHLVEHNHKGTVRIFENHGKFDQNWADVVLLREPSLAAVHDWLRDHPHSPQKDVLEAMEAAGWSRSTTQHRLARLVSGGLVTIRLQGRLKIYALAERPSPRPMLMAASRVPLAMS